MTRFVMRQLIGTLLTIWVAATLTFFVIHLVPGDPVAAALSESLAPEEVIAYRRAALGLDLPLPVQYGRYLVRLLQGDMGVSWYGGEPVGVMIAQQLPATLSLAVGGMVAATVFGVGLGMTAVARDGGWVAAISRGLTGIVLAVPIMFSGVAAIWLFAVKLAWFPATGQGDVRHLILPSVVVGAASAGGIARAVDAGLSDVLREPFIRAVRAKGLASWQVMWRHALRVGMLPALDVLALQFGYLIGGAVVTESVFARQGIGRLLVDAVLRKDVPVVQGVVLLSALVYSVLNMLADVAHAWLDPRIRTSRY